MGTIDSWLQGKMIVRKHKVLSGGHIICMIDDMQAPEFLKYRNVLRFSEKGFLIWIVSDEKINSIENAVFYGPITGVDFSDPEIEQAGYLRAFRWGGFSIFINIETGVTEKTTFVK